MRGDAAGSLAGVFRAAVAAFCLLSLLACVGAVWMWWRSYQPGTDAFIFRARGVRYAAHSEAGWVVMRGPPPPGRPGAPDAAAAARVRNADFKCYVSAEPGRESYLLARLTPVPGSPAAALWASGVGADAVRPLLDALDDPDRFAAADTLLWLSEPAMWARTPLGGGPYPATVAPPYWDVGALAEWRGDRLVFWLNSIQLEVPDAGRLRRSPADTLPAGRPDPAQLSEVRDRWHRQLDVPVVSVRYRWVVAVTALPSLLWLSVRARRAWVRRRRGRRGLCRRCGYDLRGSPSARCSECGAAVPAAGAAA